METARAMGRGLLAGAMLAWLLSAAHADDVGLPDRPWGSPWHGEAIRGLPGCGTQGELIVDVEGYIARVVQPECVGYRLADDLTVTLILVYPEIRWHAIEQSSRLIRTLLQGWRMWGLTPQTAARLDRALPRIERLVQLRARYGAEPALVPDMADHMDPPGAARGLQGYQINFPSDKYATMRALLLSRLGPPVRRSEGVGGELFEWVDDTTVAVMREPGAFADSGYFLILTRAYYDMLRGPLRTLAELTDDRARGIRSVTPRHHPWRSPMAYRWVLEPLASFEWAQDPVVETP